ncbi:SDR family oxidoreductase [Saccharomonospora sp. NPDC006951]
MNGPDAARPGSPPVALIAGGTSGIGLATARRLAASGHAVTIGGRDERRRAGAVAELGPAAEGVALDVLDADSCAAAVSRVLTRHGRVDVLVNAVGSAPAGTVDTVEDTAWLAALDAKVVGAVRLMRAVIPSMTAQRYGRIVNIAGTAGAEPDPWMVVSGAANAALVSVTNGAARGLAREGITVNAVCPGPVRTGRWSGLVKTYATLSGTGQEAAARELEAAIPSGRPADPGEVAAVIAFLASPEAAHVTGTAVTVDGGQSRGA